METANTHKTVIENEIEKDIEENGVKVTSKLYDKYKPRIRILINEVSSDLSDLVNQEYDSILLRENEHALSNPLSNEQVMEHLEKKYGPHFCLMVLKKLEIHNIVTSNKAKEHLQEIISGLQSDGQQNETSEEPFEANFFRLESEATLTELYLQNMLTAINRKDNTKQNQQIIREVLPQYPDDQTTFQRPEQCHDYPYTSTTVSGDSEGSNSSFPYSPGQQEVNSQ